MIDLNYPEGRWEGGVRVSVFQRSKAELLCPGCKVRGDSYDSLESIIIQLSK